MDKSTQYLYNIDPSELTNMPYKEALEYKRFCANELVKRLIKPHFTERNDVRLNAVLKARSFNDKLLKELQ